MDKKELMDLMQFVIDSNKRVIYESTVELDWNEKQQRNVLNAVEAKTKDCFFRMIELNEKNKKTTKRKAKK